MLSHNLKTLRMKRGMSQEELAEKVSVVRQTVSKWEKGLSVPDSELLIKLSEVLDVPVGTLLGEDLQPEQEKSELRKIAEKLENLNAMLAERNARGRTLMKIAAICLIAAASVYAAVELLPLVLLAAALGKSSADAGSVGIIGGADGPTAIFVTSPNWVSLAIGAVICAAVLAVGIGLLKKARR